MVVHLVTRLNVGGIARFLETAGEAVDLLIRGVAEPGEREASWRGEQIRLPSLARPVRPAADLRAISDLLRLLRRIRPAVLHTHASKAGALGRAAAAILRIPCVHTFHGHVLEGYFGRWGSRLAAGSERLLARRALLTATGPETARDLEARLGVPVGVLAPGIRLPPPSAGARERWRASLGAPALVALCVARPAAVKELGRFTEAAREAGYLPVVAGASAVRGAVALGHVEAMSDLYEAADVVVSASRREGTPFALLEAGWCGRPVVATPVGDVPWVVGEGGILTEDLRGGLLRLRDPALRARLGSLASERIRTHFPAEGVAPRLRRLYESVRGRF